MMKEEELKEDDYPTARELSVFLNDLPDDLKDSSMLIVLKIFSLEDMIPIVRKMNQGIENG